MRLAAVMALAGDWGRMPTVGFDGYVATLIAAETLSIRCRSSSGRKHAAASRSPGGQAAHGQTIPTVGSLQVDLDPVKSVPALPGYQAGDRAQQGGRTWTCACPKETGYGFPGRLWRPRRSD
jgi:hypothetical protein